MEEGRVEAIHVAAQRGAVPEPVDAVRAIAGAGLEGDRYAHGTGTWCLHGARGRGRDLTLIEGESLDALALDFGLELAPGGSRRNLTTRGVRLNELVGRRFLVGGALCEGIRLCEPCTYLEEVTGMPVREPLRHRAGLRADIVTDGVICVGDPVVDLGPAPGAGPETG